jgi:glycosyltransferase involved in cell wall biosynthesis
MNNDGKITALICTYSRSEYIYETIKSIKNQSHPVDEILIVESGDYVFYENYKKGLSEDGVRVLYLEGALLGAARNYGIKNSKEGIIIFGDDDDIWNVHRVSKIIKTFNSNNVSICVHNFEVFGKSVEQTSPLKKIMYGHKYIIQNIISNKVGGGSSFAAKKEILSLIQFDENLKRAEDIDWWLRLMIAEVSVAILEDKLVSYRLHSGRMSGMDLNGVKGELYFIRKYLSLAFSIILGVISKILRIFVKYIIK